MSVRRVFSALPYIPIVIIASSLMAAGSACEVVGERLKKKAHSLFIFLRNKTLDLNKKYGVKS